MVPSSAPNSRAPGSPGPRYREVERGRPGLNPNPLAAVQLQLAGFSSNVSSLNAPPARPVGYAPGRSDSPGVPPSTVTPQIRRVSQGDSTLQLSSIDGGSSFINQAAR